MMRLYTENGEFVLPDDFAIEMQTNNPVFTSEGSASVTFNLPATPQNLESAGRPDRLSRSTAFVNNVECIMQLGAFQIQGSLIVTSCNSEEIGCCFAYAEGSFYSMYKDKSLKDILQDIKYYQSTTNIGSIAINTQWDMEDSDLNPTKLVKFPVEVQLMEGYNIILNALKYTPNPNGGGTFGDIIYEARSYTNESTTINVPEGYGVTAFPLLHHIIEVILKAVGNYNIVRNDFAKEPFNRLVLLHPVADLICKGNIAYRDLVPDITLSAFISWLQDKFGAYVYANNKDVYIVILDELMSEAPSFDLTPYMDGELSLEIPSPEGVSIAADTSLAAAPANTLSEFQNKYGSIQELTHEPYVSDGAGVFVDTTTGELWQGYFDPDGIYRTPLLGYNNFPFGSSDSDVAKTAKTTNDKLPGCRHAYAQSYAPILLHLGNAIHYNTAIEGEEAKQEHPLMVAWAYYNGSYWSGSVTGVKPDGTVLYSRLNPEGIYHRFWSKFYGAKLNLAPNASIRAHIPVGVLRNLDIAKPVLVGHNRAIIKSYSWTVSNDGIVSGQFSLMMFPNITYPNKA